MRHVRYEKDKSWHEYRATNAGYVEASNDQFPTWSTVAWDDMSVVESYWDTLDLGYTKTVLNEGKLELKMRGDSDAIVEILTASKKHKCICKWEVVYREGCRCGGA